jgi:adenylate kinase
MTSRDNDIANELRELLPDAEWPGLTPAPGEVPAGYFEQLPEQILQRVRTAEVKEELETLSPLLAEAPKSVPLTVPPDYFNQLSQQILQKINTDTAPEELPSFLAEMPGAFPMSAPDGYFNSLPALILQKIHATEVQEELAELSPLLAGASKKMPQTVPAGYFEQLSERVTADILSRETATAASDETMTIVPTTGPVIRRLNTRHYFKWAVAASLMALVSVSTLYFVRENRRAENVTENTLAGISDQEIMDYLQSHADAFDKEELASYASLVEESNEIPAVDELPAEAIQTYLDNTGLLKESLTDN